MVVEEKNAKMLNDEIVDRLVAYRKAIRMTQQDVSEATGIQRANVARIEGKKYTATLESLQKYANCMGLELQIELKEIEK